MSSRTAGRPTGKSNNRERLLDAALTLFCDHGFAATRTQGIIDLAGVSKPVLYHYFASKEALFTELVGKVYEVTESLWEKIISKESSCISRLRHFACQSFLDSASDTRIPRLMMQTQYGPPTPMLVDFMTQHTSRRFAMIVETIHLGLDKGELCGGDPEAIALHFCCLMDQQINILVRLENPKRLLTTDRANAMVDAFLHGCGRKRRETVSLPPLFL